MTWYLEIKEGPDPGRKETLAIGTTTIGRDGSRCNLVLADEKASRIHALVKLDSNGIIFIEDQGSTHGTYVNGKVINSAVTINANDSIVIGDTKIGLAWLPEAAPASDIAGESKHFSVITIGRETSNDLVIEHPEVSRSHARIEKRADGFYLSDLNSSQGTVLNGQKINGTVILPASSWVNICGYNYFFDGEKLTDEQGEIVATFSDLRLSQAGSMAMLDIMAIPFNGREALKWLLGSILSIIPIVSFFASGYRYKLYQNGSKGNFTMPEWDDWKNIFIKGFFFSLVKVIYLMPPSILFYFFVLIAANSPGATPGLLFAATIPGALLLIAVALIMPMGWGRFAASGNFGDAFKIFDIIGSIKAVSNKYLTAMAVVVGLWISIALISMIPFIGIFFSVFGSFFVYIVSGLLFGNLYRQSMAAS